MFLESSQRPTAERALSLPNDAPWRLNLLKAADLIRQKGHAKFILEDPFTGGICLHGAIYEARRASWSTNQPYQEEKAVRAYLKANRLDYVPDACGVYSCDWNNAKERTAEEVIAALEGAACITTEA